MTNPEILRAVDFVIRNDLFHHCKHQIIALLLFFVNNYLIVRAFFYKVILRFENLTWEIPSIIIN